MMNTDTQFLKPAFFSHIWGGTLLRDTFGKPTGDSTGESWELSARNGAESRIDGGAYDGMTLSEYTALLGTEFWGRQRTPDVFPLLIKLIGAKQKLSVQVHPSDSNCMPGESGKAEAWVILRAPEGAALVFGTACGREDFRKALEEGRVTDTLRMLPVKAGDVLNIEAGRLHAITEGIVLYEIQQNSDTTYRFYDWDRVDAATGKPRQLHVERAFAVTDFDAADKGTVKGLTFENESCTRTVYIANDFFTLERLTVKGCLREPGNGYFASYTLVSGHGQVNGREVKPGDTLLTPAAGTLVFEGSGVLLKGWAPGREYMKSYLAAMGAEDLSAVEQLL